MNTADLSALLDRLRAEPRESEWLEFKANGYELKTVVVSAWLGLAQVVVI